MTEPVRLTDEIAEAVRVAERAVRYAVTFDGPEAWLPVADLRILIAAARREWRPIETAPSGVFVMVAIPGSGDMLPFVAMARKTSLGWCGMDDEGLRFEPRDVHQPTHWMPLPEPPALPTKDPTDAD